MSLFLCGRAVDVRYSRAKISVFQDAKRNFFACAVSTLTRSVEMGNLRMDSAGTVFDDQIRDTREKRLGGGTRVVLQFHVVELWNILDIVA